jgi:maltose phosphorylase
MGKTSDQYLQVNPWKIIEAGFHPDRSEVSESLFSLANEHQGVRGFFDEGYSGDSLIGSYLNGIYEERFTEGTAYKGISNRLAFMVNTVNWLYTRIELDGEVLDLSNSNFSEFQRELDFQSGELNREFVWQTQSGKKLHLTFSRLLSMQTKELACQKIRLTAVNFSGQIKVTSGLDFSIHHRMHQQNYWNCPIIRDAAILGVTTSIHHRLFAGMKVKADAVQTPVQREKFIGVQFGLDLNVDQEQAIEKNVILHTDRNPGIALEEAWHHGMDLLRSSTKGYQVSLEENRAYWSKFWSSADITIEGDPETQQGIRFCIFQMQQTYRGLVEGANIGAKGLTGEAYNGNAFWDTETYCLPFYLFSNPQAAKYLLEFRYKTLPQAKARARDLDCEGACFPVATSDGTESCTLWQHASLQFQPTTAVAYGVWHYYHVTGDKVFLHKEGIELLVEICRFLVSRGQWSAKGRFGYYAVMGPDEFQMMVNHNAYTNYMAKRTFEFTLSVLKDANPVALGLTTAEIATWQHMAEKMYIPYDAATGLFEQHEGFFDLPHIDIDSIPVKDFPLYYHWSYDRIYRNDMIKQPDVLMFMFLYNQSFTPEQKKANYEYYEPRCIHESSLSPSVHSILAAELGRKQEAFDFFKFATRIDLDNYNRNSHEGIHTTSIAAAWMNIVYGFGGMRSDGEMLLFNPTIPPHWKSYSFQVLYYGSIIRVEVNQNQATWQLINGDPVKIKLGTQEIVLDRKKYSKNI